MPRGVAGSRMIGSSSRFTNSTCVLGSLPGLAPTTNMRPNITGLGGYKAYPISNNQFRMITTYDTNNKATVSMKRVDNRVECGFNRKCKDSKECVEKVTKA
tara:strand:+ start:387 stop:689 length:303 start_codon:yes stop_codon:yes gene_type:complete